MALDLKNALTAYNSAIARPLGAGKDDKTSDVAGSSFAKLVESSVDQSVNAVRASEKLSMKALSGEADMRDVVMAISNAEIALETVVAVRDKVVSAYQEIMRMPI